MAENEKNDTQQEYVWHLNTQPERVPEVGEKKGGGGGGGLKGGTSLLTLTEGVPHRAPGLKSLQQFKIKWNWNWGWHHDFFMLTNVNVSC